MPKTIADDENFCVIWAVLETFKDRFDRIVMLDVFERFSYFGEAVCAK
jgi:cyclopropane fatty-acyl-phospholipid synthase-like methyltransferase